MNRIFSRGVLSSAFRRLTAAGGRRAAALVVAAGVLAGVVVVGSAAQAALGPRARAAAGATSSACPAAALPASARVARGVAADISPFDIAKWVGEKTASGAVGAVGGLAFNEVLKISGLKDKLEGPDPILKGLEDIKTQLAGVNERLDRISSQIAALTKEIRLNDVNRILTDLCHGVIQVEDVYAHKFIPSVQAGLQLAKIWVDYPNDDAQTYVDTRIGDLPASVRDAVYPEAGSAKCPIPANEDLIECHTPRDLVSYRLDKFKKLFTQYEGNVAPAVISGYLTVHTTGDSVMTAYGAYLMTKRWLTRADSESLRGMYDQFAQAEALAAWMSMEYHSITTAEGPPTPADVLRTYQADKTLEEQELSPMIPEGVVIDLESKDAKTTHNHPIWMLASTQDTTYWPIGVESNGFVTTTEDGAANAVKALNVQGCSGEALCLPLGQWRIPSTLDLKALLSGDDCKVDTTKNPPALSGTCKPFVNTSVNVATYLMGLDPTDPTWTGVFCNWAAGPCAAGQANPPQLHNFIWTTDRRSHNTQCGPAPGFSSPYSRTYSLRVGLPLNWTDLNSPWPIYPGMPSMVPDFGVPSPGLTDPHVKCDHYALTQIHDPANKGIVLATNNTGTVDFMANPGGNAAVQDTTARQVTQSAAVDSARYARHNHGSFAGLSLATLRHYVPEARSGEPGYLIAAQAIDGGTGFIVTARGEGTEDTFTITHLRSGSVLYACSRVDGGAGRHGCQDLKGGHGRW